MEAPRQMPLECLLGGGDVEECDLYVNLPEPYIDRTAAMELTSRLPWLFVLLGFLTVSAGILEYFDALLQRHLVIAFYLTALIGCGGNAGSQASSLVLQELATGELVPTTADVATQDTKATSGIAANAEEDRASENTFTAGDWIWRATASARKAKAHQAGHQRHEKPYPDAWA